MQGLKHLAVRILIRSKMYKKTSHITKGNTINFTEAWTVKKNEQHLVHDMNYQLQILQVLLVFNVETEIYLLALISLCIYSDSLTWGW